MSTPRPRSILLHPTGRAALASVWLALLLPLGSSARAELTLQGLEGAQRDNVLAHLDFDNEPCNSPPWRIQQLYQAAPAAIRVALEALGYYDVEIASSLELAEDCWRAEFTIDPGEPVRIRVLDLRLDGEASDDEAFAPSIQAAGLTVGEPLNHGRYEQLKRSWTQLALQRGYAGATFIDNRIDVFPEELAADVVLHFDSGPRYRFGEVEFDQDVLSDRLIRAYLPFRTGDPYDSRQLTELHIALTGTNFFDIVDIRPLQPDSAARAIPISVALTESPRRLTTYGVGYSTDVGLRLRFGRNNRRSNYEGHQFGVNVQLSPVISEVTGYYRMPLRDPRREWVSFDVGAKREVTETSESESFELAARRVVETRTRWTRTQQLSWLIEDFEVADQPGHSRLLMPGIGWTRTRADNTIRPRRGSKLALEMRAAVDSIGSDTSFAQVIAQGRWIWSLPNDARVLVSGQVGTTWKEDFSDLPPSVRFFAGGDNSVRGYEFESLGPTDADGEVIGGSSLITGSFEYERPLRARWSIAFFVDSGNAFEGSDFRPRTSAGLGGRWQSPLGPVRLDVAFPFDDDDDVDDWRIHISLGPDL